MDKGVGILTWPSAAD